VRSYQRNIFGGEVETTPTPEADPALARRIVRRDLNRELRKFGSTRQGAIRGTPNPDPSSGPTQVDTPAVGIPRARIRDIRMPAPFHAFDNASWQRLGTYKEVPVDTLHTAQSAVDRRRVQQIVDDPSTGVNVRLPHEKPYVLHTQAQRPGTRGRVESGPTDVLINGNHRVAAEIRKGAMFVAAQVVDDTPENRSRALDIDYARGLLDQSAEGSRALREGLLSGAQVDRTKEFVESRRRSYWDLDRMPDQV
jgi:hypothetical protein